MLSIIVPSFNENENIRPLVHGVFEALAGQTYAAELIIVDDSSPDGTAASALELARQYPGLRVIVRKGERGLSSAILRGFQEAKGDIFLVMDADLSHPAELIPKLVEPILSGRGEMVIASRYIKGGGTEGWPRKRRIISKGATFLARAVTGVKDPMSGFFAIRKDVVEGVRLDPLGYKIGLEVIARGNYRSIIEVPFIFRDRRSGQSKLNRGIMKEYLVHLSGLLLAKNSVFLRFLKFCVVGGIGTVVNLAVLYILTDLARLWYIFSAVVAFCVAVTCNFLLNRAWTFSSTAGPAGAATYRFSYPRFFAVSVTGLALNLSILYLLVDMFHLWYMLAQVIAIVIVTVWNYMGTASWAFRQHPG